MDAWKKGLDLLAVTAGPQPNTRTYLGLAPATTALGQLLVNTADNPNAQVFSDYLVTEHGWDKDLADDAGVLLSCAVSGEQDKAYGDVDDGEDEVEGEDAEAPAATAKPRLRYKRRKVGQMRPSFLQVEEPPIDEKVVSISEYRLPQCWRRALDLLVARLPPPEVRQMVRVCPSGRNPAEVGQVPATELFSKVIRRFGWIMEREWIAEYLSDHHGIEDEYIQPIMGAYHAAHAASVDCFWRWEIVDALLHLDTSEFKELLSEVSEMSGEGRTESGEDEEEL